MTDDGLDRLIAAEQDERRRIALFLHDGPVQNLAGIALMLDAALHSIETGQARRRASGARARRSSGSARRSASCATSRSRSSRSCCATRASARRCARSRSRSGRRTSLRIDLDDRRGGARSARRRRSRSTRSSASCSTRRSAAGRRRASRSRCTRPPDGGVETFVSDDAEPERRRRSFEAIEERVKQLHGTIDVDVERRRHRGSRSRCPPYATPAIDLVRPMAGYLLFVWSPAGYTLREMEGDPPEVGPRVRGGRADARRQQDRRLPASRRHAGVRVLRRRD